VCLLVPLNSSLDTVVGILVEATTAREDDEGHLSVAEDGELIRLLEEPIAALAEGDLPARVVLDPLDLNPSPTHAGDTSSNDHLFFLQEKAHLFVLPAASSTLEGFAEHSEEIKRSDAKGSNKI